MIKDILAGQYTGQQQLPQMQQMQMPQMGMMQQPMQIDAYGQQNTGVRAALLGRFMNGF